MANNPYAMDDDNAYSQDDRDELPDAPIDDQTDDTAPKMRSNRDAPDTGSAKKKGKCGCGCLLMLLIGVGAIFGFIGMGIHYLKESAPFQHPLSLAEQNPIITAALGTPLEIGMAIEGSVNFENDDGKADISYPISGPNGEAVMTVRGIKKDGVWTFSTIECRINGTKQTINLATEPQTVDATSGEDL